MKCQVVRHYLLGSARPARPASMVADHLARCAACRAWQRQLVHLERLVPEIAVPPSTAKADCLHAVLHSEAYSRSGEREVQWRRRERAIRKVAVTFAMAAGLLFFALVWYGLKHQGDGQDFGDRHPAVTRLTLDHVLSRFGDGSPLPPEPSKGIQRLVVVARRLHAETEERVKDGTVSDVEFLARHFEVLVQHGILPLARNVPAEERPDVLAGIADQLSRTESLANQLSKQRADVANPLQFMAKVAEKGHLELRKLARGEA